MHPLIGGGEGTVPIKIIFLCFICFLPFTAREARRAFFWCFCYFNGFFRFFQLGKLLHHFHLFLFPFFHDGGGAFLQGGFFLCGLLLWFLPFFWDFTTKTPLAG